MECTASSSKHLSHIRGLEWDMGPKRFRCAMCGRLPLAQAIQQPYLEKLHCPEVPHTAESNRAHTADRGGILSDVVPVPWVERGLERVGDPRKANSALCPGHFPP